MQETSSKQRCRTQAWYAAGLAFECTRCGQCCSGPNEGVVWVTQAEATAMAAHLGLTMDQMRSQYLRHVGGRLCLTEWPVTNNCIFLADRPDGSGKYCRVYPVRPIQCRTWPFWPSNVASPESWAYEGQRCRGINRGELFDQAEIDQRCKATHE